jgi:hypothetical protein
MQQPGLAQTAVARDLAHRRAVVPGSREMLERTFEDLVTFREPFGVRAAPRRRDLGFGAQPFTAPEVSPSTICRLKKMYMISGGIVMSRMSVNSRFHEVWY